MLSIRRMTEEDAAFVVACNAGTDRRFLVQWSGDRCYTFPLTEQQVAAHMQSLPDAIFLQSAWTDGSSAPVSWDFSTGRCKKACSAASFSARKNGDGDTAAQALRLVTDYAFDTLGLRCVGLRVYDYNTAAVRCYQNAGFVEKDRTLRPGGETAIYMEKCCDAPQARTSD